MNIDQFKAHAHNYSAQLEQLQKFLIQYQGIWNNEILNNYPSSLEAYPTQWLEEIESLNSEALFKFDAQNEWDFIQENSLKKLLDDLKTISATDQYTNEWFTFSKHSATGLKLKKMHEISRIIPFLQDLITRNKIEKFIDIGGGVGNFARIVAFYCKIPVITIDADKYLQELGEKERKYYIRPTDAADYQFKNLLISENYNTEEFQKLFTSNSFILGLHTCGNLANLLLQISLKYQVAGLLNFGCCYLKLSENQQNISNQTNPLILNKYGLTLATRSHGQISKEDHLFKLQVKKMRYALHLFLVENENLIEFIAIGEGSAKEYNLPFAKYFKLKTVNFKLKASYSDEQLEAFFHAKSTKNTINKMIAANFIRWKFGRALEKYLLLDRVNYLEKHNKQSSLLQFFDDEISPRNIGIFWQRDYL